MPTITKTSDLTISLTRNYGTFKLHTGTMSEICGVLAGSSHIRNTDFFYNGTDITAVEPL